MAQVLQAQMDYRAPSVRIQMDLIDFRSASLRTRGTRVQVASTGSPWTEDSRTQSCLPCPLLCPLPCPLLCPLRRAK